MLTIPSPLRKGDRVAILAPASIVDRHYVDGAAELLKAFGYEPVIFPSALGTESSGTYAASVETRVAEFRSAWSDPAIKCIICARGGYGCIHLLPHLDREFITATPKWLAGFSDVSALHAMLSQYGIPSLHAPMARHLAMMGAVDPDTQALFQWLEGAREMSFEIPTHPFSREGSATGRLLGGNLAVLNSLAGTPYDILDRAATGEDVILFIEDVSEAIYAVERMVMRLRLNGVLDSLRGLIIGQFTDYHADRNFLTMEEMLRHRLTEWGVRADIPVAFGFPVGHVSDNRPLAESSTATLTVTAETTTLGMAL
ncbi:MAG: LD-carboxypeptidase [Muribaculaceae bacterium]|nr:LD-carboxypeptidase [Muribaculaceae bacterium]